MSKSSLSVLAKAISSKNGLTPAEAERFILKMFEVANTAIEEDKQLKVKWLGTFKVTSVKDRESVDVNTGERIVIEGRDKITFTPDNILKEIINKPFAQFETVVVNDGIDFSDIDEKFAKMEEEDRVEAPEDKTITFQEEEEETVPEQVELVEDSDAPIDADDAADADTAPVVDTTATDTSSAAETAPVAAPTDDDEIKGVSSVETSAEDLVAKIEDSIVDEDSLVDEDSVEEKQEEIVMSEDKATSEDNSFVQDKAFVQDAQVNENSVAENVSEGQIPEEKDVEEHLIAKSSTETVRAGGDDAEPVEEEDDEDSTDHHHFVIPKYLVAIVCLAFVALLGGMGWFAFNYGKMQAQRDHLATQLEGMKTQAVVQAKVKKVAPAPVKVDSAQLALNEKARQDSIRMAAASQAVEKAEASQKAEEQERVEAAKAEKNANVAQAKADKMKAAQAELQKASDAAAKSSHYDNDPRVRTGAYRIVGVAQVVTVKAGQTLAGLSKTYLGPGMECYIEAVNGASEVKAGQKLKIPKLELKKKK